MDTSARAERLRAAFPPSGRDELARRTGYSRPHLRRIINQAQPVPLDLAFKLCRLGRLPLDLVLNVKIPAGIVVRSEHSED